MDSNLENKNWLQMALQIKGSVAIAILPRAITCSLFGLLVSLLHYWQFHLPWINLGSVVNNVVFNLVLGLLLVFRTNTAYDRFWEGRKAWGTLVVNLRNLARQMQTSIPEKEEKEQAEKSLHLNLVVAFAIATKLHLRREFSELELSPFVSSSQIDRLKQVKTPPLEILRCLGDYFQKQADSDRITLSQLTAMNELLDKLVEGLTNGERILTTPIPVAYTIYLKRLLLIYCCLLPFQLVVNAGLLTFLLVFLISFILFSIEEISQEIQEPFGHDPNDLPLDEICHNIQKNVEDLRELEAIKTFSSSQV